MNITLPEKMLKKGLKISIEVKSSCNNASGAAANAAEVENEANERVEFVILKGKFSSELCELLDKWSLVMKKFFYKMLIFIMLKLSQLENQEMEASNIVTPERPERDIPEQSPVCVCSPIPATRRDAPVAVDNAREPVQNPVAEEVIDPVSVDVAVADPPLLQDDNVPDLITAILESFSTDNARNDEDSLAEKINLTDRLFASITANGTRAATPRSYRSFESAEDLTTNSTDEGNASQGEI